MYFFILIKKYIEDTVIYEEIGDAKKECFLNMFNPVTIMTKKFHAGGIKSTIVTLISGTLGAGCLSMPEAFRASGIAWALIQLFVGCYLSY